MVPAHGASNLAIRNHRLARRQAIGTEAERAERRAAVGHAAAEREIRRIRRYFLARAAGGIARPRSPSDDDPDSNADATRRSAIAGQAGAGRPRADNRAPPLAVNYQYKMPDLQKFGGYIGPMGGQPKFFTYTQPLL